MKHRTSRPSRREVIKRLSERDQQRMYRTSTPMRHDFRTPRQRVKEALRASARTLIYEL